MAKGLQDYTVDESTSPYVSAVVATTGDQPATRAVHMKGASANINLTVNGELVQFWLIKGHIYPISCTKASADTVVMLY
tara:strand:+ start:269 stop:505 length:237 start_codon:yes stop_codon:yes gene_type:complete